MLAHHCVRLGFSFQTPCNFEHCIITFCKVCNGPPQKDGLGIGKNAGWAYQTAEPALKRYAGCDGSRLQQRSNIASDAASAS